MSITSNGAGNVELANVINNGAGDVVVGAGILRLAGDRTGGQVLTTSSSSVTQNSSGKTFVYSGNAADTGVLSNIDGSLGDLKVDGTPTQNADTNATFGAGTGISGSNAKAQVIFREKLTVADGVLADATLVKTYGDESTKNTAAAAADLLAEAKAALKNNAANSGANSTFTTGAQDDNNRIVVSKSVVVDSLTGPSALTNGTNPLATSDFSSAGFLKAKTGTFKFAGFTSDKYSVTGVDVGVNVAPRLLSLTNLSTTVNYSGALQTQVNPNLINKVGSDELSFTNLAFGTAVGSYTSALGLVGADAPNYTINANGLLTISYAGQGSAPTPPETYTRISSDIVNLAPVSFAVGIAPATASGEDDPNICYAWNQRGSGSVAVLSVLKPSYLGLRNAKTDNQEALSNGNGSDNDAGSPCLNDLRASLALAGPF